MTLHASPGPARDLAAVLAEYAQVMAGEPTVDGVLERFAAYCGELLPVDGVGVLLRAEGGGLLVTTADTEVGRAVESLEAELGEGPCTDALRTGEQQACPDLARVADVYPRFVPQALEAGVQSVHGLPMTVRSEPLGAVDLIAGRPLALSAAQLAIAQLLTDVTTAYVGNARALRASAELVDQLQVALDSRVLLEQAKGMLSERHGIDVAEAFTRLRDHARSRRLKMHDVARAVLRGELDV